MRQFKLAPLFALALGAALASSAYAQKKLRQGRVNGGLARRERRWVKPSAGSASEGYVGVSASKFPINKGRGPDEDPGWRESAI